MKEFFHCIFRSKEKPDNQETLEKLDYYKETFELDKEWGVLIDGQIKMTPLSRRPGNRKIPLLILAPGSISFLRESANSNKIPLDFDGTKETNRLSLTLEEGEKLWVGERSIFERVEERSIFKIVDIINPATSHMICRYTSPKKFTLEKVYEGDYDSKPYEISIAGRRKIFLASSSQNALRDAEKNYYNVGRESVREVEFSEGFRRVYRIQKRGGNVPFRLAKYFCLTALHDPDL